MVKRCIGIDIGPSCLRAVQITHTGEQFHIEKDFSAQIRRTTDSPLDILKSLRSQYGFDRRANVAISMPKDAVFFRNLETDFTGREQNLELCKSVLEHNFPIQPDEIVAQICSYHPQTSGKYSVLTAAVARESLHKRLKIFLGANMHPDSIGAVIFAIHSAIVVNHPEIVTGTAIIAYICESYLILAVTQNKNVLIVRNIPIVSNSENSADLVQEQIVELLAVETEITWRKLFGAEIKHDTILYLVAGDRTTTSLETAIEEQLPCQITIVNPYAKVRTLPDRNGDAAICVAEGLALRVLAPDETLGINFLEADNAYIKPKLEAKREFTFCAILIVAIAVFSLVGMFMRLSHLENKYTQVKGEIKEIFQRTLPEETNIVNSLAQLEQKLQSLRKDYAHFGSISGVSIGPLEVLHAITKSTPPEVNISINDMLITNESIRLTGTSQSFESVYNWQQLLRHVPQFSTVDVQDDITREPESELVRFTILLSLAMMEQK